jgi:FkbM family methyltransferase
MLPVTIRKFSCNSVVRGVASRLHMTHFARSLYCRLLSSNGELRASFLGANAVFRAHDSKQLAFVDYILTTEGSMIEAALSDLRAGDIFLDVGSHYGIFSILASKLVGPGGRVIAVEPHSESLAVLRENLVANHCRNVDVLDVAFTDTTGPFPMANDINFAVPARAHHAASAVHIARGMVGDEAIGNASIPAVVKVDVEGHELAVLSGLKQTLSNAACRRLCLEVHPNLLPPGINQDMVTTFIQNCGLKVLSQTTRSAAIHVIAVR